MQRLQSAARGFPAFAGPALIVLALFAVSCGGNAAPQPLVIERTVDSPTDVQDAIEAMIRDGRIRIEDRPFARAEALKQDSRQARYCVRYELDGTENEVCGSARDGDAPDFIAACFHQAEVGRPLPDVCRDFANHQP